LAAEPVFRASLEACEPLVKRYAGFSLVEELSALEAKSRLYETAVAQPAIFAVQAALLELWASWGVKPDAVVGHSVGEVSAAYAAGSLTLEQAVRLVCARGRVMMQRAAGLGKMASVQMPAEEAAEFLRGYEDRLSIAAINDPRSVVLSGEAAALEQVVERLQGQKVHCRLLRVNYAFHSPQMAPVQEELLSALGELEPRGAKIAIYSTVTGTKAAGKEFDAAYWARNIREPVQFARAIDALMDDGHRVFVEIGPHPVLSGNLEQCMAARKEDGHIGFSLRRGREERRALLESLGALYAHGFWNAFPRLYSLGGRCVPLPTYPWQRERYWIESASPASSSKRRLWSLHNGAKRHPLLGASFAVGTHPGTHVWEQELCPKALEYLADHRIQGEAVLPGTAYIEMAMAAAAEVYGVAERVTLQVAFERMLVFPSESPQLVQVVLTEEGPNRASFEIVSRQDPATSWARHAAGSLRVSESADETAPRATFAKDVPSAIRERCTKIISASEHYRRLSERELDYGKSLRGVEQLWLGEGEALSRVRLPDGLVSAGGAYQLHPALLDACFQVLFVLLDRQHEAPVMGPLVPVRLERLHVHRRPGREVWVHARLRAVEGVGAGELAGDLFLFGDDGQLVAEAQGLRSQLLSPRATARRDAYEGLLYALEWRRKDHGQETSPPEVLSSPGAFLMLVDRGGTGAALSLLLQKRGAACVRVMAGERYRRHDTELYEIDPADPGAYHALLRDAFEGDRPCRGVLHLWSLDATPTADLTPESLQTDQRLGSISALYTVQALLRHGFRDTPRLWLVTRGAQAAPAETAAVSIAQAPLIGFGRTVALEHPELSCTRVDLSPGKAASGAPELLNALLAGDDEDEIALRADGRYVARLVPRSFGRGGGVKARAALEPAGDRPFRLEIPAPGMIERLILRQMQRRPPGPLEVEIEVEIAGLNFLDVLLALGAVPADTAGLGASGPRLGAECVGRLVAVGEGVKEFQAGQEVLAVSTNCFSSFVTTSARLVAPKPPHLTSVEAATLPVAFLTAYYALAHVGRLQKGERVLIHAGAGGTGMAAIQWAQHVGAEVFATAGSEEKRNVLRSLGVPHIMDSRSLLFANEVMRLTKGEGIDVVLNSLSGEFIPASLGVLRDHGRFLEIGKRDYFENKQLGLKPFLRSLTLSLVDLGSLLLHRADFVSSLLREVVGMFEDRTLAPLPSRLFPVSHVAEAFNFMARGQHVGKIVVAMQDPEARVVPASGLARPSLCADASYLITGGLGGLGLSVAQWMVEKGAQHLVLMGRSGASEAAKNAISAMEKAGAEVVVIRADVSLPDEVARVLLEIEQRMPPLRGIVHAAMVLDDGMLPQLTRDRFDKVIAPKMQGAWNLHALTLGKSLDFFVLYSSAAAIMGNPGQASYTAANAFLDALAHHRKTLGLCGLSINWGPFSGVGSAAAQKIRGERVTHRGIGSLTPAEGVEILGRLLAEHATQVGVLKVDVRQWIEFYPSVAGASLLAELKHEGSRGSSGTNGTSRLREVLAKAEPEERLSLLEKHVAEQLGRVLRLDAVNIEPLAALTSLGLDSLTNLELRNRLEVSLGLKLPSTLIYGYPTLAALASYLLERMDLSPAGREAAAREGPMKDARDEAGVQAIKRLTQNEAEAFLEAQLASYEEYLK
jgi:NADPH:quinone reductase-like Zn-dependent oxidoreductase/malonyl CoA-acyl carrier protein transacylase/acyl carrier protein